MSPTFSSGDLILATPLKRLHVRSIVIAKSGSLEIIKRVSRVTPDTIYLEGDNINQAHNAVVKKSDILGVVLSTK